MRFSATVSRGRRAIVAILRDVRQSGVAARTDAQREVAAGE
jgi:hypothetical protein